VEYRRLEYSLTATDQWNLQTILFCDLFLRIALISFAAGRRRKLVFFKRRRLRMRRLRKWSFKVGKRSYRIPKLRRRILVYFRRKWVRIKFRGRRRYLLYRRTWRQIRKIGRYWKVRISRRFITIPRFSLKVVFNRRRVRIVRRRRKWRVYVRRKWRPLGCRIRRYVRYKGKRRWLKRRRGKWRLRYRNRWTGITRPITGRNDPRSFPLLGCYIIIVCFNHCFQFFW